LSFPLDQDRWLKRVAAHDCESDRRLQFVKLLLLLPPPQLQQQQLVVARGLPEAAYGCTQVEA
jgi:hypothetical protein